MKPRQLAGGLRKDHPSSTSNNPLRNVIGIQPQTHPDRLAAVATLFGMDAVPVGWGRILEIGCGQGTNLIPIANAYSGCDCVGVDPSAAQIEKGKEIIDAADLGNIRLIAAELEDLSDSIGEFDYIICHDIYSRVAPEVREKILKICKQHLSRNGVAIISYSTLPGAHQRQMVHELMDFHAQSAADADQRDQQAKGLMAFLSNGVPVNSDYGRLLQEEFRLMTQAGDAYFSSGYLNSPSEPILFRDFAASLEAHGLQYVNEVDLTNLVVDNFPPEISQMLSAASLTEREQYSDFLLRRSVRHSVICRDEVSLRRTDLATRLKDLNLASPARTEVGDEALDMKPGVDVTFCGLNQISITVDDPLTKAGLALLAEAWPHRIKFSDLETNARIRVLRDIDVFSKKAVEEHSALFAEHFITTVLAGAVSVHAAESPCVSKVSKKPKACHLVQVQAESGPRVTSRHFQVLPLDPMNRFLVRQMDGRKSRDVLLNDLVEFVETSDFVMKMGGKPVEDPTMIRKLLDNELDNNLAMLGKRGILIE